MISKACKEREGKFNSRKRKTTATSAHIQMTLTYFSYNSLIRLNTGISGFHNNTEYSTLNVLHFFSLTHEKKKKTWHNSLSFSLSLLQWLEHFSASVKVLLENNVL